MDWREYIVVRFKPVQEEIEKNPILVDNDSLSNALNQSTGIYSMVHAVSIKQNVSEFKNKGDDPRLFNLDVEQQLIDNYKDTAEEVYQNAASRDGKSNLLPDHMFKFKIFRVVLDKIIKETTLDAPRRRKYTMTEEEKDKIRTAIDDVNYLNKNMEEPDPNLACVLNEIKACEKIVEATNNF